MNKKKQTEQPTQSQVEWLKPKLYHGHDMGQELEHVLMSLTESLEEEIAQREQAKAAADDKGKFGKYRYLSGVISGLKYACDIISDRLADEWGM